MVPYSQTRITLDDGYQAYARYWPVDGCKAAVLYFHGIQSHCGWYEQSAAALHEAGFAVLQPDRRGSGHNDAGRGHAESARQLIDDGLASAAWLRETAGVDALHLVGVSWGGKLVAAMHVTAPSPTAGITLISPGIFPIIDVTPAEKLKIGWAMMSDLHRSFDIPLNDPELFTDNPERIDYLINDKLQLHQATAGFFLASRRMDRVAAKLDGAPAVPLHVFLAGDDRIIDNRKTRELVRNLDWPCRHVTTFERSRHTLEFGADKDDFIAELIAWLRDPTHYTPAAGG